MPHKSSEKISPVIPLYERDRGRLIDVALEIPLNKTFTYNVPGTLSDQATVGKRVLAPFGKRVITGYCVGFIERSDRTDIKAIIDVLDEEPLFDEKGLKFFQWMASYYFASLGEVLSLICPGGMNIKSRRRFYENQEPGSRKEKLSALSMELFSAIQEKNGISLETLIRRLKGKSVYSAINALKHAGLVREELHVKGRIREKAEIFVSSAERGMMNVELDLSPVQAKIMDYLSLNGETSLRLLRKNLGSIDSAVRKLEQKGLVSLVKKRMHRDPLEDVVPEIVSHKPTDEQEAAINAISSGLKSKIFSPYLLYGVTGSGKTLVYLKALEEAVRLGRQAVFLVPEISLSPWPVKYLSAMFPGRVAILHSGLSDGERYDEWHRIKTGNADVVVGARSALFAPFKNAGLIIVDEEHEPSYKQEDRVRYNARDASLMMGKMFNMTVVLGSATPSIETFYNARGGKIALLQLSERVESRAMPEIELVDMRNRGQGAGGRDQENNGNIFSERLQTLMHENYELGRQTILFLNRRGFSNFLICSGCGYSFQCLNCNVSLTLHRGAGLLKCHYCDMSMPVPDVCPKCGSCHIKPIGMGTEQLEEAARKVLNAWPNSCSPKHARIARMDRDTTTKKRAHQKILDAVLKGNVDVLVGTQMVAKGHHFPDVTLVGIVSADTCLNIPDFRSSERTFQLIIQASGRAGRGDVPGKVVVQTFNPEHYCLKRSREHNYENFFNEELINRKELFYPPFSRLVNLEFEGIKEKEVEADAKLGRGLADNLLKHGFQNSISALGPSPAFLSKVKGKYRWHILLKGKNIKSLHEFVNRFCKGFEEKRKSRVRLIIDVDPATTI